MSLSEKAIRALITLGGTHRYLSTYCVHGNCTECVEPPRAPQCKTCAAPCLCSCHTEEPTE
jgi:hypothetical protein